MPKSGDKAMTCKTCWAFTPRKYMPKDGMCVSIHSHAYARFINQDDWCPEHAIAGDTDVGQRNATAEAIRSGEGKRA